MFIEESNTACNNRMFSGETIGCMHPTTERLYQAAARLKKVEGQSAVASLIGESPQTVKNWESRGISAKGAVNAAVIIGCRSEWLLHGMGGMSDSFQPLTAQEPQKSYLTPLTVYPYSGKNSDRSPVVAWGRLGAALEVDNSEFVSEDTLWAVDGASSKCKWYVVEEDMPRFRVKRGYRIAVDPVPPNLNLDSCEDGDTFLFRLTSGKFILAEFRRLAADGFEAIPDNGLPLDSHRHGVKLVGKHLGTWK